MKEPRDIIIRPHITEKMTNEKENFKYAFEVNMDANKYEIKRAVEQLFKVKVVDVKTIIVKGKRKRLGRFEGKNKR
jgi:large subunit ribosomal protein L23